MPSILIVCTANQCRSPMAMALLRHRIECMDLEDEWIVDSAGTWGFDNIPATQTAIEAMKERGLQLEDHLSRRITEEILRDHDLILTMTQDHKEGIEMDFPGHAERVYLLSEMIQDSFDVLDPVGQPLDSYRETAANIDQILEAGIDRIIETARANAITHDSTA